VVVPSDVIVPLMLEEGLAVPLDHARLPNLANVAPTFLDLDFDPGNAYSVPYQWGTIGIGYDVEAVGTEITSWRQMFEYDGPVSWLEDVRPMFGVVLSILTLSALQGGAFTTPSAMAKAGLLAMTQSLAVEWGPHGIRLVAIAPGTFPTEAAVARLRPGGLDHAGVPLRRAGRHEELADLAAFLVSDHAGYITGECVVADGGRRLLGGARAGAQEMLDWSDEDWAAQRARTPAR
jgi:NAD(P)-dependent dehydrogenase (short-subunit alcohol dehydrogenase family)